jgi:hypothetical protein
VVERVGGGGCPQRMCADLKPELRRVRPHKLVNADGRNRLIEPPGVLLRTGRNSAPASSAPWPAASRYSWIRAFVPGCSGR